jgi:hypothetical protein
VPETDREFILETLAEKTRQLWRIYSFICIFILSGVLENGFTMDEFKENRIEAAASRFVGDGERTLSGFDDYENRFRAAQPD